MPEPLRGGIFLGNLRRQRFCLSSGKRRRASSFPGEGGLPQGFSLPCAINIKKREAYTASP